MQRHGFGLGEYKYFGYPLPPLVEALRHAAFPRLAVLANAWMEALGESRRFPARLEEFLAACHGAGQAIVDK